MTFIPYIVIRKTVLLEGLSMKPS